MRLRSKNEPQKLLKIVRQHNFIMYDNLQQAFNQKRFNLAPRPFPAARIPDLNGVEPWQKSTLEILVQEDPIRQFRTFYNAPKKTQHNKQYTTLRGFSVRAQKFFGPITKAKSVATTSRKSAISQYNINGNILGDFSLTPKSLPFELPAKPAKSWRLKDKTVNTKAKQYSQSTLKGFQSLIEIKRKMKMEKQKANNGFIYFNRQADQQLQNIGSLRRKSKVIALGFHKLSLLRATPQRGNKSRFSDQPF